MPSHYSMKQKKMAAMADPKEEAGRQGLFRNASKQEKKDGKK